MSMQTAGKLHLESSAENRALGDRCVNGRTALSERKLGSTSQSKINPKNEINLTKEERKEAAWIFKQYDRPVPGWLRLRFIVKRDRRKVIKELWEEAGLDGKFCWMLCDSDDWSGAAHRVWHKTKGLPLCK